MDNITFNEFEGWDIDNSSALIIIGLKDKYREDFDCNSLLFEYSLDSDTGELQNYQYASYLTGIDLIAHQYGFDVHKNNLSSQDELIKIFNKFNFDYFWFFDGKQLNFISDYNWDNNKDLIEKVIAESDIFITTQVCTVSSDEEW